MKLVLLSDTHGKHDEVVVPDGDVLVHAGDVSMTGRISAYKDFAQWLSALPHKHKILIAGNHDFGIGHLVEMLDPSVHYLQDSNITIDGIKFYGSPYTPRFGLWAWMEERGEPMRRIWNQIPDDTNVLITHGPPAGILDKTIAGDNAGCKDLFEAVTTRIQPEVHIFGHIHEGAGIEDYRYANNPCYVNASVVNEYYEVVHPPTVVEI